MMLVPGFRIRQFYRKLFLLVLVAGPLPSSQLEPQDRAAPEVRQGDASLQPARADATAERIFTELIRRNELRNTELRSYSEMRSYSVSDQKGKGHGERE